MNPVVQRVLFSVAVLGWAGTMLFIYASGRLGKYLIAEFHIYVLAGGLGLAVLGLFNLLTAREKSDCGHDHGPDDPHDHETPDIHPVVAVAILLVPLGICLNYTQEKYSGTALAAKGVFDNPTTESLSLLSGNLPPMTRETIEKQHPQNADGFHPFTITDLYFTSIDPEIRALVEGMPVETEGRMVVDRDGPTYQRRLYRMVITCCIADSQAIPIVVRFHEGEVPDVEENTWMKISGTIRFPDEGEGNIPVLEATYAEESIAPLDESFTRGKF